MLVRQTLQAGASVHIASVSILACSPAPNRIPERDTDDAVRGLERFGVHSDTW